jgi:hypothetical protein
LALLALLWTLGRLLPDGASESPLIICIVAPRPPA